MGCDPGRDAEHTGATWVPSIHGVHNPADVAGWLPHPRRIQVATEDTGYH